MRGCSEGRLWKAYIIEHNICDEEHTLSRMTVEFEAVISDAATSNIYLPSFQGIAGYHLFPIKLRTNHGITESYPVTCPFQQNISF